LIKIEDIEQQFIEVIVEYYDDAEKNKLLRYPTADSIDSIVKNGLKIPVPEFLTYWLFHRKRPGKKNWSNYQEISQHINMVLNYLQDFTEFNGKSISKPPDVGSQINTITEYIGESIGLSLINKIHNITNADWDKIPQSYGRSAFPTFDYQIASDGKNFIQIETKGSSVDDNQSITASIQNHKTNIAEKKSEISMRETDNNYSYPASIRYGTIAAVDSRKDSTLKCWILDPDSQDRREEPRHFRLISRMHFLRDWISFLGPRSQLATALSNRVKDLETIKNPFELDGKPLLKSNNEPFDIRPFEYGHRHTSWFANKSRVTDGPAGGIILQLSKDNLFFLGIYEELLFLAANQDFEKILDYKHKYPGSVFKTVECIITKDRFHEFDLPDTHLNPEDNKSGRRYFDLTGQLHYAPEGIVFGLLPRYKEENRD